MKDFVHMSRFEKTLFSGAEWIVNAPLWLLLQLQGGAAYARSGQLNVEMATGGVLVVPPNSPATVLASQLGQASLRGFSVRMNSLMGFLTAAERRCLEGEAERECAPFRQVAPPQPLAALVEECLRDEKGPNLPARLGLMQAFTEWLSPCLERNAARHSEKPLENPKMRLARFLSQIPELELAELNLGDVARILCCGERHASRLFHEVCSCGFRDYVSELRLKRACQMLTQADYKVIDVAMGSGHSSLAQFNYVFKKRFRMTPSEWRGRHLVREERPARSAGLMAAAMA